MKIGFGTRRIISLLGLMLIAFPLAALGGYEQIFNGGIQISDAGSHGIKVLNANWAGLAIEQAGFNGVTIVSAGQYGIQVKGADDDALRIDASGGNGLQVDTAKNSGVYIRSTGGSGVTVGSAKYHGVYIKNPGPQYDFIRAVKSFGSGMSYDTENESSNDVVFFTVTDTGVWTKGQYFGGSDFAELVPAAGDESEYEAGDVLIIATDSDRTTALSATPYSTAVMGVYSSNPGFVGSLHRLPNEIQGEIPVAIMGIVPCKVSAENGPISRGNLLATSSTPGHAMKATEAKIGTILGKALGNLESGTGVIDVLLTLQ